MVTSTRLFAEKKNQTKSPHRCVSAILSLQWIRSEGTRPQLSLLTFSRVHHTTGLRLGAALGSSRHPRPGLPAPPHPSRPRPAWRAPLPGHRHGLESPRLPAPPGPQTRLGNDGGRGRGSGAGPSGGGPAGSRPPPAAPPPLPVMAAAGQRELGGAAWAGAFGC